MPTVLITGANRGLGLEFTRQYAADGWNVIACCREPEKAKALQELAQNIPAILIQQLDILSDTSIKNLIADLKEKPIDVLINNAGVATTPKEKFDPDVNDPRRNFGFVDADLWADMFRANSIAPIIVTQNLLPLIHKGSKKTIIFISSRMASMTKLERARNMVYRTSKAALNMAMRCAALTLQPEGVTVVSLHPGWVKTDMGGKDADITPEHSVTSMRRVIATLTLEKNGQFLNFDGTTLPW